MDQSTPSLDTIKAQASNWSLQGDADLLECLVNISNDVIQKVEGIHKKTADLCVEVDRTHCDLLNVSNHFAALSNKQYIERRVAEEEPIVAKEEHREPTESTAEKNRQAREEIVKNCLSFLDDFYEEIETPAEGTGSRTTLKLKAPTKQYCRLPYIIGTKEFENDDFIGLKEPIQAPTTAEAETLPVDERWESSSEAGTIASSEDASQPSNQSSHRSSFLNELHSTVETKPSPPLAEVRVSQPKIPPLISAYDQREPPALFNDEEEEGDDSIFGSGVKFESTVSNPSKANRSFDAEKSSLFDDDDEDDLFSPPKVIRAEATKKIVAQSQPEVKKLPEPVEEKKPTKKLPPGAVSLFGNKNVFPGQRRPSTSSESSNSETPQPPTPKPQSTKEAQPTFDKKSGLFSDESDDGDLFAAPVAKKNPTASTKKPVDLFADVTEDEPPKVVPKVVEAAPRKTEPKKAEPAPPKKEAPAKKISLFGDSESEEEDIFASFKTTPASKPAPVSSRGLFDDDEDLFQPKPKQPVNLFAAPQEPKPAVEKAESKVLPVAEAKVASPAPKIEKDLPPKPTSPEKKIEVRKIPSSAYNFEDSADLLGPPSKPIEKDSKKPETNKIESPSKSDSEDLFAVPKSTTKETAKPLPKSVESVKTAPTKDLFESSPEDDLFAAPAFEEAAQVERKIPPKPPVIERKFPPAASKPEQNKSVAVAKDLFESPESENPPTTKSSDAAAEAKASGQSVKRRGLALNINPLALLPGSKPLKTPTPSVESPTSPQPEAVPEKIVEEPKVKELTPPAEPPPLPEPEETLASEPVPETSTPDAASFDEAPAGPSQLSHLGKERIRIKQKRKPPSRRGFLSPLSAEPPSNPLSPTTDEDDLFSATPSPQPKDNPITDALPEPNIDLPTSQENETITAPPVPKIDLFGATPSPQEATDDLFTAKPPQLPKEQEVLGPSSIFSEPPPLPSAADDIFGDDDDDFFSEPIPQAKPAKLDASFSFEPPPLPSENPAALDDDYDLFADAEEKNSPEDLYPEPKTSTPQKKASPAKPLVSEPPQPAEKDIFEQDDLFGADEDIFSTSKASSSPQVQATQSSTDEFLSAESSGSSQKQESPAKAPSVPISSPLDADSDDDFLFGPSSKITSSAKKASPKTTPVKPEAHDIFGDDEDLFAATPPKAQKKKDPSPALFADEPAGDLFGGPPAFVTTKKPMKKQSATSLFGGLDEEEDELFGAPAASKSTTTSKPKSTPKTSKTQDFDDPLLGGMG